MSNGLILSFLIVAAYVMSSNGCYIGGREVPCQYGCCRNTVSSVTRCCTSFSDHNTYRYDGYYYSTRYSWFGFISLLIVPIILIGICIAKCVCFRGKPMFFGRFIGRNRPVYAPNQPVRQPVVYYQNQGYQGYPSVQVVQNPPGIPGVSDPPPPYPGTLNSSANMKNNVNPNLNYPKQPGAKTTDQPLPPLIGFKPQLYS